MEAAPDISKIDEGRTQGRAGAFQLNARWRFAMLGLASIILFVGAIRLGDLAGYDDALYSLEAKGIVQNGDWLTPKRAGGPALEHPPLFVWTEAVFLSTLGISDSVAKLPTALCAIGTVLLCYWLARRLLKDTLAAAVAMFIMLATPYFIKYAGRAMTDVPTTFLFIAAICAWSLTEENSRWYLAAGLVTALALMARGLIGLGLPAIFAIDLLARRRRWEWRWLVPAFAIAMLPVTIWYAYLFLRYQGNFVDANGGWLSREVFGALTPPWRRYTGAPEYAWMLVKSYWPWLPAMVAGIVAISSARKLEIPDERRRSLFILLGWAGVVFLLCAAARSRVLRYMLPAYPAFSILAPAIGILKWTPRWIIESAMDWAPPFSVVAAECIILLWPPGWHAKEIRGITDVHNRVLQRGERVGFYDKGDPRYDETNQMEWYGSQTPVDLDAASLDTTLHTSLPSVLVVDRATYQRRVQSLPHEVIAESGNLVSVRLRTP